VWASDELARARISVSIREVVMQDEEEAGIVRRLLRETARASSPDPDLTVRTLQRVRTSILLGDLMRLATLDALWARLPAGDRGADPSGRRQDP
jgi:hypothetical protein